MSVGKNETIISNTDMEITRWENCVFYFWRQYHVVGDTVAIFAYFVIFPSILKGLFVCSLLLLFFFFFLFSIHLVLSEHYNIPNNCDKVLLELCLISAFRHHHTVYICHMPHATPHHRYHSFCFYYILMLNLFCLQFFFVCSQTSIWFEYGNINWSTYNSYDSNIY